MQKALYVMRGTLQYAELRAIEKWSLLRWEKFYKKKLDGAKVLKRESQWHWHSFVAATDGSNGRAAWKFQFIKTVLTRSDTLSYEAIFRRLGLIAA